MDAYNELLKEIVKEKHDIEMSKPDIVAAYVLDSDRLSNLLINTGELGTYLRLYSEGSSMSAITAFKLLTDRIMIEAKQDIGDIIIELGQPVDDFYSTEKMLDDVYRAQDMNTSRL